MAELGFELGTSGSNSLVGPDILQGKGTRPRETRDLQSTALPFVLLSLLMYCGLQLYLIFALHVIARLSWATKSLCYWHMKVTFSPLVTGPVIAMAPAGI